jgi:diguanylate cyclase (GGDEF)-like protein
MDGLELCRRMRELPDGDRSVILMITALDRAEDLAAVLDAGASDYLSKPFRVGVLEVRLTIAERQVGEIAARKRAEEALSRMARTDGLTGLANRWATTEALEQLIHLARRRREPLALAMIDIDEFKLVNDRYGHAAGDSVLQGLGSLLTSLFRPEDAIGRWGGEEFVVGLFGADKDDLARRLTTLQELLRKQRFVSQIGGDVSVTFSAGIAEFPEDGDDVATLTQAADVALYAAKSAGRDRVFSVGQQELMSDEGIEKARIRAVTEQTAPAPAPRQAKRRTVRSGGERSG